MAFTGSGIYLLREERERERKKERERKSEREKVGSAQLWGV